MKIPTWLRGHVKDWEEQDLTTMTLCSSSSVELLEVWYYGDLYEVRGEKQRYIVNTERAPVLIFAREPETGEKFLIFDAAKHGYDNMFCDTYDKKALEARSLEKMDIPASKLILKLGYSIDYKDEKDEYDFDESGDVLLVNLVDGRKIPWEDVLMDGFDYLALSYINGEDKPVQFVDAELA
ncbi:MAG: hypothetical protein LBD04_03565 [Synergistaceae bacterium]|jgi:hypothetical protein|nr:hypothetical protein [Synergistaceae bacterium]